MSLLLTRLHLLRSSSPLLLNIQCVSSKFSHRHLSTATTQPPPPKPHFSLVDYLVKSCGLSSEEALQASKKIDHLKSPDQPEAVLRFLKEIGLDEWGVRAAVLRYSGILCYSVENSLRPTVAKLQELGVSTEEISSVIRRNPMLFKSKIESEINFWMAVCYVEDTYSPIDDMFKVLGRGPRFLSGALENFVPNFSFLKEQLFLRDSSIFWLIKLAPLSFGCGCEDLMAKKAKEAEEMGISFNRRFVYALTALSNLNQMTIKSRLSNLENHGFSRWEITTIVRNRPPVLKLPEEVLSRKLELLMKEVGFTKMQVIRNSLLLTMSLEKRLIPRNLVRELLKSKEHIIKQTSFITLLKVSDELFKQFILRYERYVPGLQRVYTQACSGKSSALKVLK